MCKWGNNVKASVLTSEGLKEIEVDACMKPLVEGLAKAGVATAGCCCGHGKDCPTIILADGRVVYILDHKPWEVWHIVIWAIKRAWQKMLFDLRIRLARIGIF